MSIQIIPVADTYVESFHACVDSVSREKKYLGKFEAWPLERFSVWVKETIAADVAQFIAVDDLTVVGWCDVFPAYSPAVRHCGTLGMGLIAEYRGRGIGTQLLRECLAKAGANGLTRIQLEARADNIIAINLYKKIGFVHEVTKVHALRYDGIYYDAIQMSMLLE